MSLFFDVWMRDGFILSSDVRVIINGKPKYGHKIFKPGSSSKVNCALAVCGAYPEVSKSIFFEATSMKDTLKDVAKYFATKWVERFAGTDDYSAVHLVGFEVYPDIGISVPQMWYWTNNINGMYLDKKQLENDLASFTSSIPNNNHIPYKIKEHTGKFPDGTPQNEAEMVISFLNLFQPFFTWNGDSLFWQSAAQAVGSAMNLLWREKANWSINDGGNLAKSCLTFLAEVGGLLDSSTVGLSNNNQCDVLLIKPDEIVVANWADIKE
jgi:hypothetical protein